MKGLSVFKGKVGIVQRVLPTYRIPFFDQLAGALSGNLEIFAGEPTPEENIHTSTDLRVARLCRARNIHFPRRKYIFCWQRDLITWIRRYHPDVLVLEANPRLLSNYSAIRLMRAWGRPVIGWGLGALEWSVPGLVLSIRKKLLKEFYSNFDVLIAYSSTGVRVYQELGFPAEKIFVAPNAVSTCTSEKFLEKNDRNPDAVRGWQALLGLPDKPLVLFVGRLTPQKQVSNLIEACAGAGVDCSLLIVGDGPDRPALESLARRILPETVFLGHRSGEELALCFAAADLFVLPGLGGLAVQEAMSYGLPVVVAAGDGTQADLVREGKNGFHVPPGDISALTKSIETCLGDPARLREMGAESRRIVLQEHNIDVMVDRFVSAIEYASRLY